MTSNESINKLVNQDKLRELASTLMVRHYTFLNLNEEEINILCWEKGFNPNPLLKIVRKEYQTNGSSWIKMKLKDIKEENSESNDDGLPF